MKENFSPFEFVKMEFVEVVKFFDSIGATEKNAKFKVGGFGEAVIDSRHGWIFELEFDPDLVDWVELEEVVKVLTMFAGIASEEVQGVVVGDSDRARSSGRDISLNFEAVPFVGEDVVLEDIVLTVVFVDASEDVDFVVDMDGGMAGYLMRDR